MNKKLLSIIALILVMCFVLVGCGETTSNAPKAHEHTFESGDNWEKNATGHWHKALCDHKEVIADFDDHNDDNDDGVCDDCGYSDPNHTHTWGDTWYFDNAKHWNKSTCKHTGVIGNEAPHTPNILGVCTVCGATVSTPSIESVEEALELGTLMKDNVAGGTIVEGEDVSASYEFKDGYLYIEKNSYGFITNIYYTPDKDGNVLGVIDSEYGAERIDAVEANLWGPQIDTWFMGGLDDYVYGVEHLLESLYEIATRNENGDFKEAIIVEEGMTVYTFSFGYYNAGSLYMVEVAFALDETNYFINAVGVSSAEYFGDNIKEVVAANGDKPAQYAPIDETDAFSNYYIMAMQTNEIVEENPYDPEDVLMQDFELIDPNGNLIEDGILHIVRGEDNDFQFQLVTPEGTNFFVNSITFSGENVNDYIPESLFADYYAGNDYFTLKTMYAAVGSEFELIMNVNGKEFKYTVIVDAAVASEIYAGTVNGTLTETDYVEISEGQNVIIGAHADMAVIDFVVTIDPTLEISADAFENTSVYDMFWENMYVASTVNLSYLPVGTYTVTFTVKDNDTLTKTINVVVTEKAPVSGGEGVTGSGTDSDPFLIVESGSYVANVPAESTLYYIFTAPAADTYTFKFDGDFFVEIGTNPNFLDILNPDFVSEKSFTLAEGESVYVSIACGSGPDATDVNFTISGTNTTPGGGEEPTPDPEPEDPKIVASGTLTVDDGDYEFGIDGEYTYTIDENNVITVYMNGEATDVIGFIYNDMEMRFDFTSTNINLLMTTQGAMFATEDGSSVTVLEGKIIYGSKRGIYITFTFTPEGSEQPGGGEEPTPDPEPDPEPEPEPEVPTITTGSGTKDDPFIILTNGAGSITVTKIARSTYVTFSTTKTLEITIYINGKATMVKADGTEIFAKSNKSYTVILNGTESTPATLACFFDITNADVMLDITTNPAPYIPEVPENNETMNSMLNTNFDIGDNKYNFYKDEKGYYLVDVNSADLTKTAPYYFEIAEAEGMYKITLTPKYEDKFNLAGAEIFMKNTAFGWIMTVNGETMKADPVRDALVGFEVTVGDIAYSFGKEGDDYVITAYQDEVFVDYKYTYTLTDNGDGTYSVTVTACDEDGLELAAKTIVLTRTSYDAWTMTVDGNAQKGDPISDSIAKLQMFNINDYIVTFYNIDEYYITITLGNDIRNYAYTITDNGNGVYTFTFTESLGGFDDVFGLVGKNFTATYGEKGWSFQMEKPTAPVEPPVSLENLTEEERMGIEQLAEKYEGLKNYITTIMEEYAKYKDSDAYKKVDKPEMTEDERGNIEKLVSRWELSEETKKGLMEHFFASLNALKAKLYEEQTIRTIKEATEASANTRVVLTGFVKSISAVNTIVLQDEMGATIEVYKLGTTVALGDTIVVTGVIAVNSGVRIVAEGATAEIKEAHGDNHKYESGKCTLCGKDEPAAGEKTVAIDLTGITGEKNVDEEYKFDGVVITTHGNGCQIDNAIIINTKKTAYAIIASEDVITSIQLNVNGKYKDAVIYVSADGSDDSWTKIGTPMPMNDKDLEFTKKLDVNSGYKYIKIVTNVGGITIKDIVITVIG